MSTSTEELYQAILSRIESQCDDEFCEDLCMRLYSEKGNVDPDLKECIERLTSIYTIAHAFNKAHICYHAHDPWRAPILSLLAPVEESKLTTEMEMTLEH